MRMLPPVPACNPAVVAFPPFPPTILTTSVAFVPFADVAGCVPTTCNTAVGEVVPTPISPLFSVMMESPKVSTAVHFGIMPIVPAPLSF